MHTHHHHVGDPVQFFKGDGTEAAAGQITHVHDDGHTCCLVAWCPVTEDWYEHADVPHGQPAEGGGPYFCIPCDEHEHPAAPE